MLDFLRQEGIEDYLIARIEQYRSNYPVSESDTVRIPSPRFKYYGKEIWQLAITAILSGENILLVGPKATGKTSLRRTFPLFSGGRNGISLSISIPMLLP